MSLNKSILKNLWNKKKTKLKLVKFVHKVFLISFSFREQVWKLGEKKTIRLRLLFPKNISFYILKWLSRTEVLSRTGSSMMIVVWWCDSMFNYASIHHFTLQPYVFLLLQHDSCLIPSKLSFNLINWTAVCFQYHD